MRFTPVQYSGLMKGIAMSSVATIINVEPHATGRDVFIMPYYRDTFAGVYTVGVGIEGDDAPMVTRDGLPLWVTHELWQTNDDARSAASEIASLYVRVGNDIHAIGE